MKKVINNPENVVNEMVEGFIAAFGNDYKKVHHTNGVVIKNKPNRVAVVTGGGSGHEPLFIGMVGEGLADGAAIGNVFAAPTPNTVLEVTKELDSGQGVLYVYGNYSGDVLNFDMAAELAELEDITTKTVLVNDDVASATKEHAFDRRGIAGDIFAIKIAGAAANDNLTLEEVARITQKAANHTRSIGVALSPSSIPSTGKYTFEIADDEIELGMGIHGEPGVKRTKLQTADELTANMLDYIFDDIELQENDEVCVLVNGLGSTTLMELFIVNRKVVEILNEKGISIYDTDVNSYCTTLEMAGVSITLMKLDDELKNYYDKPAYSPYYFKKGRG
ncbi:dihydroxyacetone kinase-like protein [Lysinibacillus composti]|uniref:Dihydroxyacetone kinase subunit DhaK n=1 Tax=Lysinibacillus composti TaxID=720633 RepID=A0A3N9UKL5_9BACI|nr:dihydroxyacetone kinase subunit DhaK [Lysinibacillus composti]MBM7607640.1 dihydroxyacetone kinase-like protein [Lysinibacillus composti]RQW75858.1 dihydroxyacetone kinase subunit DhaK [Lysinibacillus composti]